MRSQVWSGCRLKSVAFAAMPLLLSLCASAQVPLPSTLLAPGLSSNQLRQDQKGLLFHRLHQSIPQIASSGAVDLATGAGSGLMTLLNFQNLTNSVAEITVAFLDDAGQLMFMSVPRILPDGTGDFLNPALVQGVGGSLQPRGNAGQVLLPDGTTRTGHAVFLSTPPGAVAVNATFIQAVPGRPLFMAGVPPETFLLSDATMPVVNLGGFTSTLAVATESAQTVTLIGYAQSGVELCRTSVFLPSLGHRADLVVNLLSCMFAKEGTVRMLAPLGASAIGIWAHDTGGFVTQPFMEFLNVP